jgi:nucleoid DNA-binding protein
MLKNELIKRVSFVSGKPQDTVRGVLDATMAVVRRAVSKGDSVMLFGIGKIKVVERGEKQARNIHTGEAVVVPPRKVVVLQPSDPLNEAANGGA